MAVANNSIWEVRIGGNDTNGGYFCTDATGLATNGAVSSANTSSPVFSSATYNFVASDVGAWLFLRSGTNSIPGWYKIASVASNAATLTASVGTAIIFNTLLANTSIGCGTTATLSSCVWTIDYTQQDAKNTGTTNASTTDAVANGTTTITSATANFQPSIVGNGIYFSGGSGSIAGTYARCVARVSTTSITIDAAIASSTGMTMNVGGAHGSLTPSSVNSADANYIYVKNEGADGSTVYPISTTITFNGVAAGSYQNLVSGYGSIRSDGIRPVLRTTAAVNGFNLNRSGIMVLYNLIIDGNNVGLTGVLGSQDSFTTNCLIKNWTSYGISLSYWSAAFCEVTGCTSTYAVILNTGATMSYCYIHDNAAGGVYSYNGGILHNCVIANNTGIGYYAASGAALLLRNCLFYNNTSHGLSLSGSYSTGQHTTVYQNIFAKNGGYGINANAGSINLISQRSPFIFKNAFWSNTSGTNSSTTIILDPSNITLTANPFIDDVNKNWALNNTAGGGANIRAASSNIYGLTTSVSYLDIGPFQHQDTPSIFPIMD